MFKILILFKLFFIIRLECDQTLIILKISIIIGKINFFFSAYGEVVATLERLQLQLRNLSGALGISGPGVEAELEAVRSLVQQRRFATALATHNFIKTKLRTGKLHKAYNDDASNLARDCVELFEECQTTQTVKSPETIAIIEELTGLLTSYDMEGLLFAHDSIISYCDGIQLKDGPLSSSASEQSLSRHSSLRDSLRNTDNIKIIKIEKTNEPLGATVRNEGDAVIIGNLFYYQSFILYINYNQ